MKPDQLKSDKNGNAWKETSDGFELVKDETKYIDSDGLHDKYNRKWEKRGRDTVLISRNNPESNPLKKIKT